MGGAQVFVFASTEKKGDKSPDARLMLAQREFQRESGEKGQGFDGFGGEGEHLEDTEGGF